MFEESLVESTALLQTHNRWPALLACAAQAVAALVILSVPMLHPEMLPMHAPALALTPPPPPRPPQPPKPLQRVHAVMGPAGTPEAPSARAAQPSVVRTLLPSIHTTEDAPISTGVSTRMPASTETLSGIGNTGASPKVAVAAAGSPAHAGPVSVSSGVTQGLLLAPIRPEYPALAKVTRQQGTVVVRAIISRTGAIESAEVQSGPAMLQQAALEAVKRAHYRPFLLNGQPTEVDTTVTITFKLGL